MYLAYLAALTHGLTEHAERLKPLIKIPGADIPEEPPAGAKLMQPPTPIIRTKDGSDGVREEDVTVNWPQLTVPKSAFEGSFAEDGKNLTVTDEDLAEAGGAWDDDGLDFIDEDASTSIPACEPHPFKMKYSYACTLYFLCGL